MASFCNTVEVGFVSPSFKVNFFNCWEQLHASTKGHKKSLPLTINNLDVYLQNGSINYTSTQCSATQQ